MMSLLIKIPDFSQKLTISFEKQENIELNENALTIYYFPATRAPTNITCAILLST